MEYAEQQNVTLELVPVVDFNAKCLTHILQSDFTA